MAERSAKTNEVKCNQFLFWLIASLLLIPWIYVQHQTSINSDTAWLSICAQRLLSGGSMLLKLESFANYITEDIELYAPSLMLILTSSPTLDKVKGDKTIIEYFSFSSNFKRIKKMSKD